MEGSEGESEGNDDRFYASHLWINRSGNFYFLAIILPDLCIRMLGRLWDDFWRGEAGGGGVCERLFEDIALRLGSCGI